MKNSPPILYAEITIYDQDNSFPDDYTCTFTARKDRLIQLIATCGGP